MNRLDDLLDERKSAKFKGKLKYSRNRLALPVGYLDGDFQCVNCRHPVTFDPLVSGVNNRNHCPYCLWSRHLDLFQAGDRLAACKAPMRPVGLAIKRTRKKYQPEGQGELMLVHRCAECGKYSLNRVAADDDPRSLWEVFEESLHLDPCERSHLAAAGLAVLGAGDDHKVRAQLFGDRSHRVTPIASAV